MLTRLFRGQRWLHAFHIDAFFQFCLGKPHVYYKDIPTEPDAMGTTVRDGVAPEEDLALRALVPEWRPKRGRRRNDHLGDSEQGPNAKRMQRATSLTADEKASTESAFSAYPQSAFPWDRQPNQQDPWAAAHRAILPRPNPATGSSDQAVKPATGIQHTFWLDLPDATPATPYPQSAIESHPTHSTFTSSDIPQSAHPLSQSAPRPRKRHGPSVSAAWPSATSASTGKIRGRPPHNRTVQDGPFSTFPSRPRGKGASQQQGTGSTLSTPSETRPPSSPLNTSGPVSATPTRKPSKLQLQVPQHSGGPVRLATPQPKVLLNGGESSQVNVPPASLQQQASQQIPAPQAVSSQAGYDRQSSADFFRQSYDDDGSEAGAAESGTEDGDGVDWKRRALTLRRKLREVEAELKAMRRRVMEAIM